MKRRRSSAPGRLRPDGRWSHSILLAAFLVVFVVACGQATSTEQPTASTPLSSDAVPTDSATTGLSTDAPSASVEPTAPEPTATGSTGSSAAPTDGTGSASSCSGSDENRDFFASMAAAVDWTVYCPVLPDGWFVDNGQYRLANGGWMEIVYEGPGEARLTLRQGALGDAAGGCFPPGPQVAGAAFGSQMGVIVEVSTGGWSVVVERDEPICWMILTTGIGETATRAIAADLKAVTD